MARTSYLIALGSNRRHVHHGGPGGVLCAATEALRTLGEVQAVSAVRTTPALGPAGRSFANAAASVVTDLDPDELLEALKRIERRFGRRGGRRWGPRVLDLDIILWSGGMWADTALIPHPEFRRRAFVLDPLAEIAADWRDPVTGLAVRHLRARLTAPRRAHR